MEIRLANQNDFSAIMAVYRAAQDFMISTGNPDQWGHFYPTAEIISEDIAKKISYVITENDTVHAVFTVHTGEDPTYGYIEYGSWPNNEPYVTIHRIASDGCLHGVFKAAADFCAEKSDHIRVDTYKDNLVMQHQIKKYGFIKCGTIYLANGSPRIAYQYDKPQHL